MASVLPGRYFKVKVHGFEYFVKITSFFQYFSAMDKIPVEFDYQGTYYKGFFSPVTGGANKTLFHLSLTNPPDKGPGDYHAGQLFYSDNFGWRFTSNDRRFEDLAEYFAGVVKVHK